MAWDRGSQVGYTRRISRAPDVDRLVDGAAVVVGIVAESNPRLNPENFGWNRCRFVGVGIHEKD